MSNLTRSITDRIFVGASSALLGCATGWAFLARYHHHPPREADWVLRLFDFLVMEVAGIVFLGSVIGVVWALFTPRWIERLLVEAVTHFLFLLLGGSLLVGGLIGWSWIFIE